MPRKIVGGDGGIETTPKGARNRLLCSSARGFLRLIRLRA